MDPIQSGQKAETDKSERKPYSTPRLQLYGSLRDIARMQGNTDPASVDAPNSHHKSG
jgi:hypothetical protein